MQDILAYYTSHSPFTDPGPYAHLYNDLPERSDELAGIVHGLLLHKLVTDFYNVTLNRVQRAEQFLRTIEQRLAKIADVDPSSLTMPREPQQRQVGMCRDFALLHVSMLRHKGIPARMRVGFAKYLDPKGPLIIDHWIVEYWDAEQSRWILTDTQIDDIQREVMGITIDVTSLRRNQDFYLAGNAWQLCRNGKAKSSLFRFSGRWKGMPVIRGNMLHDFQALNKYELGVQDYWDELICKSETSLTVEDKTLLDRIAELTVNADERFDDLQNLFDELPRTRIILSKLHMLGVIGEVQMVNPEDLGPSGLDRLSALADNGRERSETSLSLGKRQTSHDYIPYELGESHPANFQAAVPPGMGDIVVRGARQHNLKNIDVIIPRHKFVVITGVSGSGKSSLAFDTIYAEGQRRYVESLSSFARQFMDQMEKPQVDQITGLSPAIAIEQKTISRNPRSTVGTVTEILDHLRVLYARLGTPHCPQCGRAVHPQSAQEITNQLAKLPPGTRFQLLAPIVRNRKGAYINTLKRALRNGYTRARIDGDVHDLIDEIPVLDKNKKHDIELVVDRLSIPSSLTCDVQGERGVGVRDDFITRLMDSVETALEAASGILIVLLEDEEITLSEHNACPECDISFPELEPNLFSFNSPFGMCDECNGLGVKLQTDPQLIIVNPNVSLLDGASAWHGDLRKKPPSSWGPRVLWQLADHYNVDLELPWNQLSEEFRHVYLYGSGDEKIRWAYESKDGSYQSESHREARGAIFHIQRLFRQTKSEGSRRYYM